MTHYLLRRLAPFFWLFLIVQLGIRVVLAWHARADLDGAFSLIPSLLLGLAYDLATFTYVMIPITLFYALFPARRAGNRTDRWISRALFFIMSYLLLFGAVSEWLFWDEFGTRFNFIAVDYLIYTTEVIENIRESYPVGWLLLGIGLVSAGLTWGFRRALTPESTGPGFLRRAQGFALLMLLPLAAFFLLPDVQVKLSGNRYAAELGKNGVYSLFSAYRHNEINYETFYSSLPDHVAAERARKLLTQAHSQFTDSAQLDDMTHVITHPGPEKRYNVIMVVMESMSARFMGQYGNTEGLTPNLDRLADQGLFFTQLYATGTRTVRGLEALSLSLPPTPGNSILRRPNNENLFSLGFIFKDRGYDTSFVYGGYGYFDNMNAFFAGNGFDIVDRATFDDHEVTFSNAWGVSDEDLFRKVVSKADASYAAHRPFMQMVMTTSNHRPYTYPDGSIDIASGSGRNGAVKYSDFAVGKLIEEAKTRPWFDNTIFVFVADHTHSAAGKADLTVSEYLIPAIIYSPKHIAPRRVDHLVSQIDIPPTLLGLLDFSYASRFYGMDALENTVGRAFVSTYELLGYLTADGTLSTLEPKRARNEGAHAASALQTQDPHMQDAISLYQQASEWRTWSKRIPSVVSH